MITLALACCVLASVDGFLIRGFEKPPTTVKHLDPQKYLGKWYQTWSSASVADWFEKGAKCVTAEYGLGANKTITVLNSEREKTPTGQLKNIHGFATLTNITGQLTVTLETVPIPAPFIERALSIPEVVDIQKVFSLAANKGDISSYNFLPLGRSAGTPGFWRNGTEANSDWVLKLGPATFGPKKLYEYSVVSDNLRGTLFVLSRNFTDFELKYEQQILTFLKNDGFTTFYNKPVKTYQGNDCLYS